MNYKKTAKKKAFLYVAAALAASTLFSACTESTPELSPMPAIDSAKGTITATAEVLSSEETEEEAAAQTTIALLDAAQELTDMGSNIENNGIAVQADNTVYYIDGGIKSMSLSGNHEKTILVQDDIVYLNYYEGYLYYVSSDDYSVYRIDTETMGEPEELGVTGAYSMMIIGGYIYYQNCVCNEADGYLYRTDIEGGSLENLQIKCSSYCSDGQTIYFANEEDDNILYYFDTSTGIVDQLSNNQVGQLNIIGRELFYINKTTKFITKLNLDTMESTIITEVQYTYLNTDGENLIYYSNDTGVLGTMSTEGEFLFEILEYDDVNGLNVAGDWIFFESYENTYEKETFFLKSDGTNISQDLPIYLLAQIVEYDAETKIAYCDFVLYYTGQEALEQYIADNSVSERKATEAMEEMGWIYIQNTNPKVYEYKLSDLTDISLFINADSSYSAEAYSASISTFEEMYEKDSTLILNQLYYITGFNGQLIKLEQFIDTE